MTYNYTNPVARSNVISMFTQAVVNEANTGIVWHKTNRPFFELTDPFIYSDPLDGTAAGRAITIDANSIGPAGSIITAAPLRSILERETWEYTRIRRFRAILNVVGTGGNTGTRPVCGFVFDQTQVSYMANGYQVPFPYASWIAVNNAGVATGNLIARSTFTAYLDNLKQRYLDARNTVVTIQINVCHCSCHSSCHGSRGRR